MKHEIPVYSFCMNMLEFNHTGICISYSTSEISLSFVNAHTTWSVIVCSGGRFGLFEAMSAIEMMDPKMDAGMIGNQVNRKVLNFEQAIKVQYRCLIMEMVNY